MFKFKQFSVKDEKCAMKIGTDGVLLGSWTIALGNRALDIGTGSGLISLMLAQRNEELEIDAIDIEQNAVIQSIENIQLSHWRNRISVMHTSLQAHQVEQPYDLIVSNPPYFESNNQLRYERKVARMQEDLSVCELATHCNRLLADNGVVSIIFPYKEHQRLVRLFQQEQLFLRRRCKVKGNENTMFKRVLLEFQREECSIVETELIIEKSRHVYTDDYINLTKEFYLKM